LSSCGCRRGGRSAAHKQGWNTCETLLALVLWAPHMLDHGPDAGWELLQHLFKGAFASTRKEHYRALASSRNDQYSQLHKPNAQAREAIPDLVLTSM
jgi:hypothetical protein